MVSEESPLLAITTHEAIYDRFAPDQKGWIVFLVSFAGFLPMFVSSTFVPSIPQIAKDLDSTHAVVSLTVSLSILASAVGGLVWAAYSSFYGRRSIYLWGMPFVCVGSCGVALSTSLQSLLFWRFVQTFGCAGGMSLGAGVIGDIYKLEERGTAIGIFFGATLLGLAVAPFLGGAATQYWSWRNLHYSIGAWGLVQMLLLYLSFPETSHPGTLGIDKIRRRRWIHITWVNPLRSLWLLRSPNLFAIMLASSLVLMSDFGASILSAQCILTSSNAVLLVPLAYTIGVRYGITNEAIIGACFLPNGLGNFIGAPVAGRLSDIVVRRWREKRRGVWYPEDRLRATWIGGLFMVPLSVGASGLITTYVEGPIGLALNLLCLLTNGMGVDFVVNPIGSYNVDVVHSRSAEAIAAHMASRSLVISAATALVIPLIERIGVAWTDIIAAVLAVIGQGIIFLTIRYGDRMRASIDVGFSTMENN
ncbi:major facilitator superfamily domain-containing protein [Suillus subalutaceus]|uniref:major facilitator superfamily domain-containing protein n=1 Tax=Suillus subalutaceus TaxID=48586 RepID=UPI001B85EA89|nr:major facilitator superfamily domain-containing protein [Suillus subalutaceus]KAG1867159.1 major facilitator superfamily domain-containing protein [Suillus subalutaceus]